MKKVAYLYGLCNVFYDGYYIKGLRDNSFKIKFNTSKFPNFRQGTFAAIVSQNGIERKIVVDSNDSSEIDPDTIHWCDIYGKVNYNSNQIALEYRNKVVPIGPSFGIKIWNSVESLGLAMFNLIVFYNEITNKRDFLANYWRQYKREALKNYTYEKSTNGYVFFITSIWKKESTTNDFRAKYIKECIDNINLDFEGGFAPRKDGNNLGYDNLVYASRVHLKNYLSKIKKSAFVFSTPAVLLCHGWKLGEFLALGKAIITTPHTNSLPEELKDNEHVVYVKDAKEIKDKI